MITRRPFFNRVSEYFTSDIVSVGVAAPSTVASRVAPRSALALRRSSGGMWMLFERVRLICRARVRTVREADPWSRTHAKPVYGTYRGLTSARDARRGRSQYFSA